MHSEAWNNPKNRLEAADADPAATPEKHKAPEKRRARLLLAALAAITASVEAGHHLTRYKVYENTNEKGEITYEHEDRETTRILNYIAGREHMTDEDRVVLFRDTLRRILENTHKPVPANIHQMNREEVIEALVKALRDESPVARISDAEQRRAMNSLFEDVFPNYTYNSRLYSNLWRLEERVGAPRVRWMLNRYQGRDGRYDPVTNTIHIIIDPSPGQTTPNPDLSNFVAESSHSEQWNDNYWYYYGRSIYDFAVTILNAARTGQPYDAAQEEEYRTPGTVEHDAHQVREFRLGTTMEGDEPQTRRPPRETRRGPYGR